MAALPKKMTAVFMKYESMDPDTWTARDFERDIIAISTQPANYQSAKSAIYRAQKAGLFPITTESYVEKHTKLFGNAP